jgi:hypothetical protein
MGPPGEPTLLKNNLLKHLFASAQVFLIFMPLFRIKFLTYSSTKVLKKLLLIAKNKTILGKKKLDLKKRESYLFYFLHF